MSLILSGSPKNPSVPHGQPLRDRLANLTAEIERLCAERDVVQAELDALVYPVLTLPVDVMGEIFAHCLPEIPGKPSIRLAPLLLARICRHWRALTLSMPILWSVLRIELNRYFYGDNITSELLRGWLSRSASYPLTLEFGFSDHDFPGLLSSSVLPHIHNCQSLALCLPNAVFGELCSDPRLEFPLLKRLELRGNYILPRFKYSFSAFQNCPKLQELIINRTILEEYGALLPWDRLIRFTGHNLSLRQGWDVLRKASSMEECTLDLQGPKYKAKSFLTLPRLKSLKVGYKRQLIHGSEIFPFMTLPGLQELHVYLDGPHFDKLLSFQSRSACLLTRLHIDCNLKESQFSLLLTSLPHLVEFSMRLEPEPSMPDYVLTLLERENLYLFRLADLALAFEEDFHYTAVLSMLESRRQMDAESVRLEVFKLTLHHQVNEPDEAQMKRFQALVAWKMRISIILEQAEKTIRFE
ncbi:hypothetical protein C8J57DRAFT_340069 [Mycena rebaudengoi]|nr:hypothetical protein C8J57DRAFT_340069 [Mycena rebaudengoi]